MEPPLARNEKYPSEHVRDVEVISPVLHRKYNRKRHACICNRFKDRRQLKGQNR